VDARVGRELVLVVRAWSIQPPVAGDDAADCEHLLLVLLDGLAAPGRSPGDALGDEAAGACVLRGRDQVAGSFGSHAVIACSFLRELVERVRKVGQLVHDRLGCEG
jgi:hypothetical protein